MRAHHRSKNQLALHHESIFVLYLCLCVCIRSGCRIYFFKYLCLSACLHGVPCARGGEEARREGVGSSGTGVRDKSGIRLRSSKRAASEGS